MWTFRVLVASILLVQAIPCLAADDDVVLLGQKSEMTDTPASPASAAPSSPIKAQFEAYLKAQELAFRSGKSEDAAAALKLKTAVMKAQDGGARLYADKDAAVKAYKEQQDLLDKFAKGSVERRMAEARMDIIVRETGNTGG